MLSKSHKISVLLICLFFVLSVVSLSPQAQVLTGKFDSKYHPKAKGTWVTIKYPIDWEKKEGDRPNIVQKFTGYYDGMYTMLALQIIDIGAPIESECADMGGKEFADSLFDKATNQIATNTLKTKHEGKPAFIYDIKQTVERAGFTSTITSRVMTVCNKNAMISAWCNPMLIDKINNRIISTSKELSLTQPLCFQFFNSLVLMDRY